MSIKIEIFQDTIHDDGTIESGPKVGTFLVSSIDQVKSTLEKLYGGSWSACSSGADGMFENSNGGYGECLVSNISKGA